jgi:hypothetical protein
MTERQTKASSGRVVSIFKPKQLVKVSRSPNVEVNGEVVQSGNVDNNIVRWEVIQNIALGLGPEGEKPCYAHGKTHDQRYSCRVMRDSGETVEGGPLQGAVDEKAVVICED